MNHGIQSEQYIWTAWMIYEYEHVIHIYKNRYNILNLWNWKNIQNVNTKLICIAQSNISILFGKQRNSIILNIYFRIILEKVFNLESSRGCSLFMCSAFFGWPFTLRAHCASAWRLGGLGRKMNKAPLALGTVNSRRDAAVDYDCDVDVFLIFWSSPGLAAACKTWLGQMLTALTTPTAADSVAATRRRRRRHRCSQRGCAALFVFMTANWSAPHTNSTVCTHELTWRNRHIQQEKEWEWKCESERETETVMALDY